MKKIRLGAVSAMSVIAIAVFLAPQAASASTPHARAATPTAERATGRTAPRAAAEIIPEFCGNGGSGYCMNAWNGGPYVKMYQGGDVANDYFYYTSVSACSGTYTVQSTQAGNKTNCPFSNASLDYYFRGDLIVELVDGNNGECIGTGNSGGSKDVGYLGSCGSSTGSGAIQGAFDVIYTALCPSSNGTQTALVNRYWTNTYNTGYYAYVSSGGNPGTPLYVGETGNQTCWASHNG